MTPLAQHGQTLPVLLLDVDGVVAPIGRGPDRSRPVRTLPVGGWIGSVFFHSDVTDRLGDLIRTGRVDARWLTTWEDEANLFLAEPLGFGHLPVHHRSEARETGPGARWWKEQVVEQILAGTSARVVWCDDEMPGRSEVGDLMHHGDGLVARFPGRLLSLCPDPGDGLTTSHLDQIETFVGPSNAPPTRSHPSTDRVSP